MTPYRIKRHRKREHANDSHMSLVPFIDMLMILVVFLLVHTADVDILPNSKNISIPQSLAETKPRASVVVMITKNDVLVDGQLVASVAEVNASDDALIRPLREALVSQADRVLADASQQDIADREVTIMGDRDLPYKLLKKVMATCTDANYGKVSLAVTEKDRGLAQAG